MFEDILQSNFIRREHLPDITHFSGVVMVIFRRLKAQELHDGFRLECPFLGESRQEEILRCSKTSILEVDGVYEVERLPRYVLLQ